VSINSIRQPLVDAWADFCYTVRTA